MAHREHGWRTDRQDLCPNEPAPAPLARAAERRPAPAGCHLADQGKSARTIAAHIGVSKDTVRRDLEAVREEAPADATPARGDAPPAPDPAREGAPPRCPAHPMARTSFPVLEDVRVPTGSRDQEVNSGLCRSLLHRQLLSSDIGA
ncbi:hypothetical protein [Streptomyces sp. NPDC006274]|uniref:hypothetical protein n=1 Tax=unclassified Streptomyces TaxID=2593676 RepID=UPI00339EED24